MSVRQQKNADFYRSKRGKNQTKEPTEHKVDENGWRVGDGQVRLSRNPDAFDLSGHRQHRLFYEGQNRLGLSSEEFERMIEVFKTPLPVTFRTSSHGISSCGLRSVAEALLRKRFSGVVSGIPWAAGQGAYQVSASREELKGGVQDLIRHMTDLSVFVRQEAVSMVPVMLLGPLIKPDSLILDICAAPGSKTAQLLDLMGPHPTGAVIANDMAASRAHMISHRLRYAVSGHLMVTSCPAQAFPTLFDPLDGQPVRFDAIVCDVPCSGDGTFRKALHEWAHWSSSEAMKVHPTQRSILRRACLLAKVGGTVVYSTCALNPLENEAVVHAVVEEARGSLEVVNMQLPEGLVCHPGLTSWSVYHRKKWFQKFSDVPQEFRGQLQKSMLPPDTLTPLPDTSPSPETYLPHSMRFYPHTNDTGGFFVAVLRKKAAMPWEVTDEMPPKKEPSERPKKARQEKSDVYSGPNVQQDLVKADTEVVSELTHKFGVKGLTDCLWTKSDCSKTAKKLQVCSDRVSRLLATTVKEGRKPVSVLQAGMTVFSKDRRSSAYRPSGACGVWLECAGERVVEVSARQFAALVVDTHTMTDGISRHRLPVAKAGLSHVPEDSHVLVTHRLVSAERPLTLPAYRGKTWAELLVDSDTRKALAFVLDCMNSDGGS